MKFVVRMAGGLANRMFQYCYYLYLKQNNLEVFLDNKYKATKWEMENIEWNRIFPYAPINQASDMLIHSMSGGYNIIEKVIRHYLKFISHVDIAKGVCTYRKPEELKKPKYLIGLFQNADIIEAVDNEVKSLFEFSEFEDEKNKVIAQLLQKENSVAIHVRKGKDYLMNEAIQNTCSVEYYREAIALLSSKIEEPHFYLFTDNVEWVHVNLADLEYTLIDHNPAVGWGNHFDMQLMSLCKHNIIANSTYSWWGAFLNKNKDKIVIGPKHWFNPERKDLKNVSNMIMCKEWILI